MAGPTSPYPLTFSPGIQRDQTLFASDAMTDGQWCRFQRGLPRKIGGYKALSGGLTGIPRALHCQSLTGAAYVHSGNSNGVEQVQIDLQGNVTTPAERTPQGFQSSPLTMWMFDCYFDINSGLQQLVAMAWPGLADISYGAAPASVYSGPVYATTQLVPINGLAQDANGGILIAPPYLLVYGSNGLVQWSMPQQPLQLVDDGTGQAGAARVASQKIIKAYTLPGVAGFSPAAILWALDSVVKMYFIGGATIFAFDTIADNSSILSSNCVAQVDQTWYWPGFNRFFRCDGTQVAELPNSRNINFFFDNLTPGFTQKVFALVNHRWGEVWWCAPMFGSTEPNWAIIYNYREQIWYDTALPNLGRSYALEDTSAGRVLMGGIQPIQGAQLQTYRLWQHELGTDEVDLQRTNAVPSSFTLPILTAEKFQQPADKNLHLETLETDFVQSGPMTLNISSRGTARTNFVKVASTTFDQAATSTLDQQVPVRVQGRQLELQFVSNTSGGTYQAGVQIANISTDSGRRTQ